MTKTAREEQPLRKKTIEITDVERSVATEAAGKATADPITLLKGDLSIQQITSKARGPSSISMMPAGRSGKR